MKIGMAIFLKILYGPKNFIKFFAIFSTIILVLKKSRNNLFFSIFF